MSDIQDLRNPYDFANPVSDGNLFIGRDDELSEINYYLEQALRTNRPTNIAIIGARASGKTSLLNVTEQAAKKLGLLTARIDLDEGDASNQWAFFFKIFDTLFSAACETGAYGGTHSKTFDAYVDVTCSLSIPEDKTFCPFLFPIQYAKALGGNNLQGQVPDYSFRQDLRAIQTELKRPVVLLFDEGNVLSKSRVHLQKLRNIFMNAQGYMLILTGTPDMFPLMDEVFSPIIRQFKKILLNQFVDQDDTESLIRKYLETVGVQPDSLFDFDESNDLEDIHDLTGGRPYEIQLVCHTLFRRVQQGRASKMGLDLGVIEEVRQQLESSQNLAGRPILNKVKALDSQTLEALAAFSPCVGSASLEQVSALEHILGMGKWLREDLASKFSYLRTEGILDENEKGILVFKGDDFDKIYIKYFSREKDATVQFPELPFPVYTGIRLGGLVQAAAAVRSVRPLVSSPRPTDFELVAEAMGKSGGLTNVFVETPISIVRSIYRLLFDYQGLPEITLIDCRLSLAGADLQAWYAPRKRGDTAALEACQNALQIVKSRATDVGGNCFSQRIEVPVPLLHTILQQVASSGNRKLGELIAEGHLRAVTQAYASRRTTTSTDRHALAAYSLREFLSGASLNNLGYFYFAKSDLDKATALFQLSIEAHRKSRESYGLPAFNLAMVHVKNRSWQAAISLLREISELTHDPDEKLLCLFVPRRVESVFELIEIRGEPKLSEQIQSALTVLCECQSSESDS